MSFETTLAELQQLGTEQNVKTYRRHGAGENVYGVSFANLKVLKKRIKIDQELAVQLWATGNTDACTLALMIADPQQFTAKLAETWLKDMTYAPLTCYLAELVSKSSHSQKLMLKWMASKNEAARTTGYSILSTVLRDRPESLTDDFCNEQLARIEAELHGSANNARHAMSMAVCAIGIWKSALTQTAIATALRIGRVEVDHGDTSCKTPDAAEYILKATNRETPSKRKRC